MPGNEALHHYNIITPRDGEVICIKRVRIVILLILDLDSNLLDTGSELIISVLDDV